MAATNFAGAIALAVTMTAGVGVTTAAAQSVALPAEFPPASYTASQYVDSKGCAFVRAGMDGVVNWVPRVDRSRNQLCNFKPTVTRTAGVTPPPAPAVPVITVQDRTAPVGTPAARTPVARPAPRVAATPRVVAPVRTAATTRPAPAPTPRVVTAPPPRRISFAEACEGRFGVQTGFISARTGQPIDCGAAPQVAAARVQATPAPLRLTLAAACQRQLETGQRLIDAATGAPIVCAAPVQIAQAAAVTAPVSTACGIAGLTGNDRYPVRCGPQTQSPSGILVARRATSPAATALSTHAAEVAALATGVPASNVIGASAQGARVPKGYARVWADGRINPQRGLKKPQVAVRVSTRSVAPAAVQAPAAASGHRYVQVGSFGDPANAARLIARLHAAGMPVASGKSGGLKIIAAGPFRSPRDLQRALGMVRGMGFADAYTRG